jgi:hypothetical protein
MVPSFSESTSLPKPAEEVAMMLSKCRELITNPHGMTFLNTRTVGTNRVTSYAVCCVVCCQQLCAVSFVVSRCVLCRLLSAAVCCVVCCQQLHKVLCFVSDMEVRFNLITE